MSYTCPPCMGLKQASNKENPRVFLDLSFNGGPPERIVIELFSNIVPTTAENFRLLCTGERKSKTTGKRLHYKGTVFYHIRDGFFAMGGDISDKQDGSGEESAYGGYFNDENFLLIHSEPGVLSVANRGPPNTNGSQFIITLSRQSMLDWCHVVFGKVISGLSTVCHISEFGTPGGKPSGEVKITDCGQIYEDKEGEKKKSWKRASSSVGGVKELGDERKKRRKCTSSETGDVGELSEDKKSSLMESDQGEKKKSLKRASSCSNRVKELSHDRQIQMNRSSSEGLPEQTESFDSQKVKAEVKTVIGFMFVDT